MLDKRIAFDDYFIYQGDQTTTFFFTMEKSLLNELYPEKYPNAESGELSIEVPWGDLDIEDVTVSVSPTHYYKEKDMYVNDDWQDISLPQEEIKQLIEMAEKIIY